jgi:hypothetical protein
METSLSTTQVKTINRLRTAMSEHNFKIKDKQKSDLPDFLKKGQNDTLQTHIGYPVKFNKAIHIDAFYTIKTPENVIITITDYSTAFSVSIITADNSITSTVTALQDYWFKTYGYTDTISFKQGKVQANKLEKKINDWVLLEQKVICKSRMDTFNTEVEQQWKQNQHEVSISFMNFRNRNKKRKGATPIRDTTRKTSKNWNTTSRTSTTSATIRPIKQGEKIIILCRHKLQGRTGHQSRRGRQQSK